MDWFLYDSNPVMKELSEIKRNYNARQNGICNIICFDSVTMHKSKKLKPLNSHCKEGKFVG